ncbi:MAG: sugar ABC transporter permease [Lachnospiraceae bacterium]
MNRQRIMRTEANKNIIKENRKKDMKNLRLGLLFISPIIIGFCCFDLYPIIMSLYYSFTDFSILRAPEWIGIDNYVEMFMDPLYWKSVLNTLYFTLIGVPLLTITALLLAVLLNLRTPLIKAFRALIYIPSVVPTVACALLWSWILNPNYGLLNSVLRSLGVSNPPGWLADPTWAKLGILLMLLWGTGGQMVIFLAALQGVPDSLKESARLDGANAFQIFIYVTIPMIRNVIFYFVITQAVALLQFFAQAYVMSSASTSGSLGGSNNCTLFYGLYLYQEGFGFLKMGYASAMAWILLIISLFATWLLLKFSDMFD